MKLHHIIDILRSKNPRMDIDESRYARIEFLLLAEQAVCFDFGDLHFEPIDGKPHMFQIPKLTNIETEMWRDGLLPLPFPICYFECRINGLTSGFIVKELYEDKKEFKFEVARYDWRADYLQLPGIWVVRGSDNESEKRYNFHSYCSDEEFHESEAKKPTFANGIAGVHTLALYFLLMINSSSTDLSKYDPPIKLNRARIKRGVAPIRSHTIVTIVPERFKDYGDAQGGHHASPRLHWRRSHRRTLANGKVIAISRCLVGKRELGEITHEYRVKM